MITLLNIYVFCPLLYHIMSVICPLLYILFITDNIKINKRYKTII